MSTKHSNIGSMISDHWRGIAVGSALAVGAFSMKYCQDPEFAFSVEDRVADVHRKFSSLFKSKKGSAEKLVSLGFEVESSDVVNPDAEIVIFPVSKMDHLSDAEVASIRQIAETLGTGAKLCLVLDKVNEEVWREQSALLLCYTEPKALGNQHDLLDETVFPGDSDRQRLHAKSLPDKINQTELGLRQSRQIVRNAYHSEKFREFATRVPVGAIGLDGIESYVDLKAGMKKAEEKSEPTGTKLVVVLVSDEKDAPKLLERVRAAHDPAQSARYSIATVRSPSKNAVLR